MNSVSADSRCCINDCKNFASCLQKLKTNNKANVSASKHQDFFAGFYAVQVHHCLGSSGSDNTGERPSFKGNHIFGSTSCYDRVRFPLKNLPVAALSEEEEALEPPALAEKIRTKTALFAPEGTPTVLALHGLENPRFSELCKLADGVALGLRDCAETGNPLVIAVRADMGKALGQAVGMLLPETPKYSLQLLPKYGQYIRDRSAMF